MAKITITEQDLTTAGNSSVTENVVYIPGYATMGPVNTPTVCSTLAEFQKIFGTTPYKFNAPQSLESVNFAQAGDYEKSYLYAAEILKAGLPVLFERIADESLGYANTSIKLMKVAYRSGNVIQTIIDEASEEEKDSLTWWVEGHYDEFSNEIKYTLNYVTYNEDGSEKESGKDSNPTIEVNGNNVKFTTSKSFGSFEGETSFIADTEECENATLEITSIYPGSFGKNILYRITENSADKNLYYDLLISVVDGVNTYAESLVISLDPTDTRYFKNVTSKYVVFTSKADLKFLESGFAKLAYATDTKLDYTTELVDEFTIENFYKVLAGSENSYETSLYSKLEDRGEYNIKFITSGGYPIIDINNVIATYMMKAAGNRGDAIAIIDHKDEAPLDLYDRINEKFKIKDYTNLGEDINKYGNVFTPWAKYQLQTINEVVDFPASFAYFKCLAQSTKTNANWFAVSGVSRGQVPGLLSLNQKVTGAIADKLQDRKGISINPITNIHPYGYCIWGNRTLFNNIEDLTASSFLNIRMLSADVKKVVYTAAKKLTFELNNDVLWLNFKAEIEPTLNMMKSGGGLNDYKIIKVATSKKATIACKIRLFAIEAVEDWDVTIELADSYTSVV